MNKMNEEIQFEALSDPLSESKRKMDKQQNFLDMLMKMTKLLSELTPVNYHEVVFWTLKAVGEYFDVDRTYLIELNDDNQTITCTHEWIRNTEEIQSMNIKNVSYKSVEDWLRMIRDARVMCFQRMEDINDSIFREIYQLQGTQSVLTIPLINQNTCIGIIGLDAIYHPCIWHTETIEMAQMISLLLLEAKVKSDYIQKYQVAIRQTELVKLTETNYLSNLSREIQPSIQRILETFEVLKTIDMAHPADDYVAATERYFKTLLEPMSNLMEFANIQKGMMQVNNEPFNLTNLMDEMKLYLEPLAVEKGLKTTISIESNLPEQAKGDEAKLKHILTNTLKNAVKYTETGVVEVQVLYQKIDVDHFDLMLVIRDTGIGMSDEQVKCINRITLHLDEEASECREGIGLGLTVAKVMAEMLNGSLTVASTLGVGTIVYVQLPLMSTKY